MADVVVVGSANADCYLHVDRLPASGETLLGRESAVRPGGKGANQAAACARLGVRTAFVGQIGDDAFGHMLQNALVAGGVETSGLETVSSPSGMASILLLPSGENAIVVASGANQAWSSLTTRQQGLIQSARCVLLQREVPEVINLAAARLARRSGAQVVLDAGGDASDLAPELLAAVDVFSPNQTELSRVSGFPIDDIDQAIGAAESILRRGCRAVVIKLGALGAVVVRPDRPPVRVPALPVPVVDTTGAGDCFTAAYAVAELAGVDVQQRLRFACAAAACSIQSLGALDSMPDRSAVQVLLDQVAAGQDLQRER